MYWDGEHWVDEAPRRPAKRSASATAAPRYTTLRSIAIMGTTLVMFVGFIVPWSPLAAASAGRIFGVPEGRHDGRTYAFASPGDIALRAGATQKPKARTTDKTATVTTSSRGSGNRAPGHPATAHGGGGTTDHVPADARADPDARPAPTTGGRSRRRIRRPGRRPIPPRSRRPSRPPSPPPLRRSTARSTSRPTARTRTTARSRRPGSRSTRRSRSSARAIPSTSARARTRSATRTSSTATARPRTRSPSAPTPVRRRPSRATPPSRSSCGSATPATSRSPA